jgi:hypothetical protein
MILYHRTSAAKAKRILRGRYRGVVRLADRPIGDGGDVLLTVDLPEHELAGYELAAGAWIVPAEMINARAVWERSSITLAESTAGAPGVIRAMRECAATRRQEPAP